MTDIFNNRDFTIEVCNTTLRLIASNYDKLIDTDNYLYNEYNYKYAIIDFIKLCYIKILKDKYNQVPKLYRHGSYFRVKFDATYSDNTYINEAICKRPFMSVNVTLRDYIEMHIDNPNSYSWCIINNKLNSIYKDLSNTKKQKVKNVIPHWESFTGEDGTLKILGAIQEINKLQLS
jgi:hypothetical protein